MAHWIKFDSLIKPISPFISDDNITSINFKLNNFVYDAEVNALKLKNADLVNYPQQLCFVSRQMLFMRNFAYNNAFKGNSCTRINWYVLIFVSEIFPSLQL